MTSSTIRQRERKYRNVPTEVDGIRFDSKREARRHGELVLLERLGTIHRLRRQVPFELAASVHFEGEKRAKPALRYIADFVYFEGNATVVEDVKNAATANTAAFRIKRHLLKHIFHLDIRIVK